ncbi:MAG: hypothetical protein ACERKO_04765 [Acetanaerobacterium sp.]
MDYYLISFCGSSPLQGRMPSGANGARQIESGREVKTHIVI